jgi:hypothetical protein
MDPTQHRDPGAAASRAPSPFPRRRRAAEVTMRVPAVGFPLGGPPTQTRGKVIDRVAGALGERGRVLRVSAAVTPRLAIPVSTLRDLLGDRALLDLPSPAPSR